MQNNLIVYGCSHSNGVGLENNVPYPVLVSSKNNLNLIQRYKNSFTNDILDKIFFYDFYKVNTFGTLYQMEEKIVDFQKNDIVIFQLTSWLRESAFHKNETIPILSIADYNENFWNFDSEIGTMLNSYRDLHLYFSNTKYNTYKTLFNISQYQNILKKIGVNSIVLIWDEFYDDDFLKKINLKNYIKNIFNKTEDLQLQNKHDIDCKDTSLEIDLHLSKRGNEWLENEINNLLCYLK